MSRMKKLLVLVPLLIACALHAMSREEIQLKIDELTSRLAVAGRGEQSGIQAEIGRLRTQLAQAPVKPIVPLAPVDPQKAFIDAKDRAVQAAKELKHAAQAAGVDLTDIENALR